MMPMFQGAGGGGQGASAAPDNLFSEDVVEFALAVSEGPIRGLTNGAASFYVGGTTLVSVDGGPLLSPNGYSTTIVDGVASPNFLKFAIGVYPGYDEGGSTPIKFFTGGETSSTTVGVTLAHDTAVIRTTDASLRNTIDELSVRINFQQLFYVDDAGATSSDSAAFIIQYKRAADFVWTDFYPNGTGEINLLQLKGKTTGGYVKEFQVAVPRLANDDWQIQVTKNSPDNDEHHVCVMSWESFQCTTKTTPTYPYTAVVHGVGVANAQFNSIPDFGGVYDGIICRVPSNYNPDANTYDDTTPWDGVFKFAWTCNPAWILYDLIVNTRYGLAAYRPYVEANRFDFYTAGRWCDEAVLMGDGVHYRPRYTYNDLISDPRPGLEMLNYVAGSFNAKVWDDLNGQIHLVVDKDDPAVMMFTPENVTEAGFNYTFTDMSTRYNDITVGFVNPQADWASDIRRVPNVTTDEAHAAKYGRTPLKFIATGCTNEDEAVAKASLRLTQAITETTMVNFVTTRMGALLGLFDVILVADPLMGWSQSGRLQSYDDTYIYFRDPIYMETTMGYVVKLQTADGIFEMTATPEAIGFCSRLLITTPMPTSGVPKLCAFTIEDTTNFGQAKPFRVTAIKEVDGSPYQYEISAMEINRNKYNQTAPALTPPVYSYKLPQEIPGPINFFAESGDIYTTTGAAGNFIQHIFLTWAPPASTPVASYEVQWRPSSAASWTSITTTQQSQLVGPVFAGALYDVRVRLTTVLRDATSAWVEIDNYVCGGGPYSSGGTYGVGSGDGWYTPPPQPGTGTSLEEVTDVTALAGVQQIRVNWTLPTSTDLMAVEIFRSESSDPLGAGVVYTDYSLGSKYRDTALDEGTTYYYWVRLIDNTGAFGPLVGPASAVAPNMDFPP